MTTATPSAGRRAAFEAIIAAARAIVGKPSIRAQALAGASRAALASAMPATAKTEAYVPANPLAAPVVAAA